MLKRKGKTTFERARGDRAAWRNLAYAAKLLDEHPNLAHIRLLQTLEKNSGNTVVIMPPESSAVNKLLSKASKKK